MYKLFLFVLINWNLFLTAFSSKRCDSGEQLWTWLCHHGKCIKTSADRKTNVVEIDTCKLICGESSVLFPKPSGHIQVGNVTYPFLPSKIKFKISSVVKELTGHAKSFAKKSLKEFKKQLKLAYTNIKKAQRFHCKNESDLHKLEIQVTFNSGNLKMSLESDETYSLVIKTVSNIISARITSETYFGARHGLETLSQLTAYLHSHDSMQIVGDVEIINDSPAYKYRGLMLDTSRNFFSKKSILKLIKAMSYNKMNVFHWHITDTTSFPIEIKDVPQLSRYGVYDQSRVYTQEDVKKIVEYGQLHGIRVIPELDVPAASGEGWQWGESNGKGNLSVCLNKTPWQNYCLEPPCGQLNPTNPNVYKILQKIIGEYMHLFTPDMLHIGGDDVHLGCWNSTKEISSWVKKKYGDKSFASFMKMWGMFLEKLNQNIGELTENVDIPLIIWSSEMTSEPYLSRFIDPNRHIIQIWKATNDSDIANIVKKGYRTIFSTRDSLYLDCGFGNWIEEGNNWCSPYKDWKVLYNSDPVNILRALNVTVTDNVRKSLLGQEAAMWTEQVDEYSADGKIWPRTAALAERLWTNPPHDWTGAVQRFIYHRQRMVERGIRADGLQPLWCLQNDGACVSDNPRYRAED